MKKSQAYLRSANQISVASIESQQINHGAVPVDARSPKEVPLSIKLGEQLSIAQRDTGNGLH